MVDCWDTVTPATIHHAWRNILEGLPEDRHSTVPGEPQSLQAEIEAAVEEAQQVPGAGFVDTTDEDIREMLRPGPVTTADDIIEEDCLAQEDDRPKEEEEEEGGGVRREGLSMDEIKEIIDLGGRMRHLLEQDVTINSEARCSLIVKALAGYEDQYHAHINSLQQRKITDFLRRRAEAEPKPHPGPANEADDEDSFEGFQGPFQTPAATDEFLDEIERRKGGQ